MNAFSKLAALAAILIAAAGPAAAQQGPVESRLEARKVILAADGKETFASAQAARPGDVIEYVATYRNTTPRAIRNLEATLPIPANTELVAGSDRPASARGALADRVFAVMPLKRKALRGAQEIEEQVPLREYRYLRWPAVELAGNQSVAFSARVKVLEDAAPPAAGDKGGGK